MDIGKQSSPLAGLDAVFTVEQVATYLQVEPRVVAVLARQGKLQGFKAGREWRFTRAAVLVFIDENTPEPAVEIREARATRHRRKDDG